MGFYYTTHSSLFRHFNTPKQSQKKLPSNIIFVDKNTRIPIEVVDGVRWINVGNAGSGKTWKDGIVLSQFKNVFFLDPTSRFFVTIQKQAAIVKEMEKAIRHDGKHPEADKYLNWKRWILTKEEGVKNAFKVNVSDLNVRCLSSIFTKVEDSTVKIRRRQALQEFLYKKEKNYAEWVALCEEVRGLQEVFNDLEWVLSHDDSAPPIEQLFRGKNIVDISQINVNMCTIGVVLQALIGFRQKMKPDYLLAPENFILVALDEAQHNCQNDKPLGKAFEDYGLQARQFGLGYNMTGSAYNEINVNVRTKSNMQFLFRSKAMTKNYKGGALDVVESDWDKLPEHGCFVYSEDGKFKGVSEEYSNDKALPDFFWMEEKIRNSLTAYSVVEHKPVFRLYKSFF